MSFETILAVDFDRNAAATYKANFPNTEVRCARVEDEFDRLPYADVLFAGFPCQPHSLGGLRKASADDRDGGPDFVTTVHKIKPRHFVGENVEGILTSENGRYAQRLMKMLEEASYNVVIKLLNSVNFGVPQFRLRTFWWGIRNDLYSAGMRHSFPKSTHEWPPGGPILFGEPLLPGVTVGQAIEMDNPESEWKPYRWSDAMLTKHPPASPDAPASTVQAKYYKGGAEGLLSADGRTWDSRHPVANAHEQSDLVRARSPRDGGRCTENIVRRGDLIRRFTPLECMRLQSAPDDFKWPEGISKTAMYKIAGNGVSSRVGYEMGQAIARVDPDAHTIVDLWSGGGLGGVGFHGSYWSYEQGVSDGK